MHRHKTDVIHAVYDLAHQQMPTTDVTLLTYSIMRRQFRMRDVWSTQSSLFTGWSVVSAHVVYGSLICNQYVNVYYGQGCRAKKTK